MNQRAIDLAMKKVHLQYKCAEQREVLGNKVAGVLPFFALAEKIRSGGHWLREHPAILAGIAVAMLLARPKGALRWIRRGWITWRSWRKIRSFAAGAILKLGA